MNERDNQDMLRSADAVAPPMGDEYSTPGPHITQPMQKIPSVAALLAKRLDWLEYGVNQVNENIVSSHTQISIALAALREQSKYVWVALFCVAFLLLTDACLEAWFIYLLGTLVGHIR